MHPLVLLGLSAILFPLWFKVGNIAADMRFHADPDVRKLSRALWIAVFSSLLIAALLVAGALMAAYDIHANPDLDLGLF